MKTFLFIPVLIQFNHKYWHHLPEEEVSRLLDSSLKTGLDEIEVTQRLDTLGPNILTEKREKGPLIRFLLQFHQPLIYILIVSGIITAFLEEWVDSGVIFGVVLVNAITGYLQESKAIRALESLSRTITGKAAVLRNGKKQYIPSRNIVPGDIVLLTSGDRVPADMRLFDAREFQVNESALTGESLPVEKLATLLERDTILADRRNMAYAATLVTHGQAKGIVIATGDHTQVGHISRMIAEAHELETPLTRKITRFSHVLMYVILGLAVITAAAGLLRGQSPFDMFMASVAMAVGAVPEGLPAAVTITLAIGVSRMARRRAIIRRLPAVETLGSTTVICSDKTGTLTQNRMTVQEIRAGGMVYMVTGHGYDPSTGNILYHGTAVKPEESSALAQCLLAGILCNDAMLVSNNSEWQVQGDPTEGALLTAAARAGYDLSLVRARFRRLDSVPFESEYQYMATLHETEREDRRLIYVKGAVEAVLIRCRKQLSANGVTAHIDTDAILQATGEMAANGLRVLAFAGQEVSAHTDSITHDDIAEGLVFFGLMAIIDPPRVEVAQAVEACHRAGILVKMITGDHAATAAAIASRIGLYGMTAGEGNGPVVLTGAELALMSPVELSERVMDATVFARVAPEQKLRLVKALQSRNHVVAMTGDGVNDAPALKQADIGIAMGITGTEVAKEAADMVLTDDNFSSIQAAVEEGRGVFDNLIKFIVWTLPTNLGEGLVITAAILSGLSLPILPVQILWINMTTAGFLGLTLAFEPMEPDIMSRPPRNPETPILTAQLAMRIVLVGGLLLVTSFALFQWETAAGATVAEARTTAVNAFVIIELFYLFSCRSLTKSIFRMGFLTNPWVFGGAATMVLLQIAYTCLPVMNRLFQSAPISMAAWIRITAAGIIAYIIVESEKWFQDKFSSRHPL